MILVLTLLGIAILAILTITILTTYEFPRKHYNYSQILDEKHYYGFDQAIDWNNLKVLEYKNVGEKEWKLFQS